MTGSVQTATLTSVQPVLPIVGIGASAGGLEPLEQFLGQLQPGCAMAFVVVQHQEHCHDPLLPELLQRSTRLPVRQAADLMPVEAGCVYVAPPKSCISLLQGVLHLFPLCAEVPLRNPVDFFFRSLADDRREQGIAVIMSGTGHDGTAGARAVKEQAGLVLVQDPSSARFRSMPESAVDAGLADVVAAPEELAGKLANCGGKLAMRGKLPLGIKKEDRQALDKIVILLRSRTGHDFSPYKPSTLFRRIERRMAVQEVDLLATYLRYLQENPQELDLLFGELLIGVTGFFRDPVEWEVLEHLVIPALLAERPGDSVLRIWSAGCSTGEEAYSLAICFHEALARSGLAGSHTVQIFATDVDPRAIELARRGIFPATLADEISPERLSRYFISNGNGYRIDPDIRGLITFAHQNLVGDPPFMKLDLLVCRNLLVYLEDERQKKLLPLFHYALKNDGFLFLGQAESVGPLSALFAPVTGKCRIYRRLHSTLRHPLEFPAICRTRFQPGAGEPQFPDLQKSAEQLLLRKHAPAAVLARPSGDIVYINGRVGSYLELASGKVNFNLFAMAGDELRAALPGAFERAARHGEKVSITGIALIGSDRQVLDVTVEQLSPPDALRGLMLVLFRERTRPPRSKGGGKGGALVAELEEELEKTREELQVMRLEMQNSREELHAINDELQTANEELQSANEELQSSIEDLCTSKEELQSLNEAVETKNLRQLERIDQLESERRLLANLLDSTGVASVFLDRNLVVRRFTPPAAGIFRLIPQDVGRPLSDLSNVLEYPALIDDARAALREGDGVLRTVSSRDGRSFTARIVPLRDGRRQPAGVVLTFHELTHLPPPAGR